MIRNHLSLSLQDIAFALQLEFDHSTELGELDYPSQNPLTYQENIIKSMTKNTIGIQKHAENIIKNPHKKVINGNSNSRRSILNNIQKKDASYMDEVEIVDVSLDSNRNPETTRKDDEEQNIRFGYIV